MHPDLLLSSYAYDLPPQSIAQHPADRRDQSRLLAVNNTTGSISHRQFADITELLGSDDLLVVNDTRVFPARLAGHKDSGGKVEVFLLEYPIVSGPTADRAEAMALLKSSKQAKTGSTIILSENLQARVLERFADGKARLQLHFAASIGLDACLQMTGQVPLPPYIARQQGTSEADRERYQTVYAKKQGAVAAPTAGLHFTPQLLAAITAKGVQLSSLTLHVGYGTFAPVRAEQIREHSIHAEYLEMPESCVAAVKAAKRRGGKVWAVGTTSVRGLEYAARSADGLQACAGWCDLYIYPGFAFQVVDNLITNFHLPASSLMFLVAALCGRERLLACYQMAIREGYRFYSYGDAMAIYS